MYVCENLIQIVMFNIIKRYIEKRLRENCIKYALKISNVYTTRTLIDSADMIYNYISNCENHQSSFEDKPKER